MNKRQNIIRLENITYSYPGSNVNILDDLSLEIFQGQRLGMVAPNGSGKTTLLHTIMGLCKPQSGMVSIFDEERMDEKDFSAVRSKIGLLFQDSDDQLFCPTVLEDIAFGPLNLGATQKEATLISQKIMKQLGIEMFEQSITHRLSGGQKRLVALGAVLSMEPEVLLLDEPTAGLDNAVKKKLIHILNDLDISYLVISHEFDFVKSVTDRIYSLEHGKILLDDDIHIHHHEHIHRHGNHPHSHK